VKKGKILQRFFRNEKSDIFTRTTLEKGETYRYNIFAFEKLFVQM
jgi:hypothetical protein